MTEEKQDVTPTSSSALAQAIASSPEALEGQQPQEAQTPAKEEEAQGQDQQQAEEEPRVPYSRLKEVVDEKNWYKTQLEQRLAQQIQQQPQQPIQNPYAGMTPEEERYARWLDQRIEEKASQIADQRIKQVNPVIEAGRMELAQMKVQQFRTTHPDVKPNSPEEIAIAEKIQMGYLPEDAYKTVMWDRRVADAEKQANINVKQKMEAKKQANVEQGSIPSGATPPTKEKLTQRQRIEQLAKDMEF